MPEQNGARPRPTETLEAETQRRLLEQPAGMSALRTHDLPDEFVARVADRIIRMRVQQQIRSVARPNAAPIEPNEATMQGVSEESGHSGSSPIGVIVVALVFVAIVAATHRRKPAATATTTAKKKRRK